MYCIHCGQRQSDGNFCAKCGTAFGSDVMGNVQTMRRGAEKVESSSNAYADKVKVASKMYGNYFLRYLKHPVEVFKQGEKEFSNAVVTLFMMAILVGLVLFTFMTGAASPSVEESSSFAVISGASAYALISMIVVLASLFLTTMFPGPEQSIKRLIVIYGTHLLSPIILVVIALVLLLLQASTFAIILLLFAFLLAFFIVPLYMLAKLVTEESTSVDPLYSVMIYLVIVGIISTVIFMIFGDAVVGNLKNWFMS